MSGRAQRVALLLGLTLALVACAPKTAVSARVASALDTFALVVDPAYGYAMDACISRETLVVDAVEAGKVPASEGKAELTKIRGACHIARRAFDEIRVRHDEARAAYASGAVDAAERALDRVRAAWAELRSAGAP